MCNFRTKINLSKSKFKINHSHKIITFGSCFAENIAKRLYENKFNAINNPFGILYNPISISQTIERIMNKKTFSENELIYHNEQWHSFFHHGKFSDSNKDFCLNNINDSVITSHNYLKNSDFITITFGSAYVYQYKENNLIVANCHKIPEKNFSQYLLELDETFIIWKNLINLLMEFNPKIKIIFTVSPIRYFKYGNELNQVSKAILILLVNKLKKEFENTDYFPAYEIMMDDLRDYRFYEEDMIHPNKTAIEYIWNKLSESYFEQTTLKTIDEVKKIIKAKTHRPRNTESEAHKIFLNKQLELISNLEKQYPEIDFSEEKKYFKLLI